MKIFCLCTHWDEQTRRRQFLLCKNNIWKEDEKKINGRQSLLPALSLADERNAKHSAEKTCANTYSQLNVLAIYYKRSTTVQKSSYFKIRTQQRPATRAAAAVTMAMSMPVISDVTTDARSPFYHSGKFQKFQRKLGTPSIHL